MGKFAVAVIVGIWIIPIAIMVNKVVPDPYMDEIFHIPQARQYCRGDFKTWDPMITTPPGLYYVSLMYVTSLFPGMWFATNEAHSVPDFCSTSYLRSTNAFLAIICSILVYELIINLRPSYSERKATACAIVMALYPVHWFFTFLYYTDVASVTAVMAMLLASLKKNYWLSAMFGAVAILFRQTNVVWILFVAANGAIRYTDDFYLKEQARSSGHNVRPENDSDGYSAAPTLRCRRLNISKSKEGLADSEVIENQHTAPTDLFCEIIDITMKLWHLKWKVLLTFAPFLMVMMAFVAFVSWNGSIVLGAKEDHVASLHVAQMMYFALVSAAALGPLHFSFGQARKLFKLFWKDKFFASTTVSVALLVGFFSVYLFSIEHKYLIADNRHYTFYVWRRVIKSHKYLLIPVYIYSWISIINILGKVQRKIWVFLFICTTALVLIPAPLIEFRYYTIPFFVLFLYSEVEDNMKLVFIGFLYVLVNIFTMTMFLLRPFYWDHEPGVQQRFIW